MYIFIIISSVDYFLDESINLPIKHQKRDQADTFKLLGKTINARCSFFIVNFKSYICKAISTGILSPYSH